MIVSFPLSSVADAGLVRMLRAPATMTVLGRADRWSSAELRRVRERFGVTE